MWVKSQLNLERRSWQRVRVGVWTPGRGSNPCINCHSRINIGCNWFRKSSRKRPSRRRGPTLRYSRPSPWSPIWSRIFTRQTTPSRLTCAGSPTTRTKVQVPVHITITKPRRGSVLSVRTNSLALLSKGSSFKRLDRVWVLGPTLLGLSQAVWRGISCQPKLRRTDRAISPPARTQALGVTALTGKVNTRLHAVGYSALNNQDSSNNRVTKIPKTSLTNTNYW